MGHSQAVRQRVLIPRFPGSIPGAPAILTTVAVVAELVDALASGASVRKDVGVQVPSRTTLFEYNFTQVKVEKQKGHLRGGFFVPVIRP